MICFTYAQRDIFALQKWYWSPIYFANYAHSDIIFATKTREANITRRKPNITAKQYNSPKANITEKLHLAKQDGVFLWRADKKNIFKSFRMDLNSCATSLREACMESMQSIVWNPLQDGMESSRRKCTFGDSMRLRRYHTRWRVITYQACGLNKKIDKFRLVDFFGCTYCLLIELFKISDRI